MKLTEPVVRSLPVEPPKPGPLAASVMGMALSQPPGSPAVALGHGGEVLAIGFRVSAEGLRNPVQWGKEVTRYTTTISSHAGSGAGMSDALAVLAHGLGDSQPKIGDALGIFGSVGGILFHGLETRNAILEGDRLGAAIATVQAGSKAAELICNLTGVQGFSGVAVFLDVASGVVSAAKKFQGETNMPRLGTGPGV